MRALDGTHRHVDIPVANQIRSMDKKMLESGTTKGQRGEALLVRFGHGPDIKVLPMRCVAYVSA